MVWRLWTEGDECARVEGIVPRLASWDRSDHPQQVQLRAYLAELKERLTPLPDAGPLYLDLTVDVIEPTRLHKHYDLENYLTPLFGSRVLPARRFAFVRATKRVGGGSSIRCGRAKLLDGNAVGGGWHHYSMRTSISATTTQWKTTVRAGLETSQPAPVPPGPARVRLAWRCSGERNWTGLWKPTGDVMGPVLGCDDPRKPFAPRDDRITDLELHLGVDESLRWDVIVGMWWRAAD